MNASRGRDTARLLADFGHHLPSLDKPAPPVREARFFPPTPRRGVRQRGRGWAPASALEAVFAVLALIALAATFTTAARRRRAR